MAVQTDTAIGDGAPNTAAIASRCGSLTLTYGHIAATAASTHRGGGKADWYLPSLLELRAMAGAAPLVGGLSPNAYWSSSQASDSSLAWNVVKPYDECCGNAGKSGFGDVKTATARVRPIRAFSLNSRNDDSGNGASSGGGSGAGSSGTSEAGTSTTAPAAPATPPANLLQAPAGTPGPAPASAPPRNPTSNQVVVPGLTLVSQSDAAAATDREMRNPAAPTLRQAPAVGSVAGRPVALVVPSQVPQTSLDIKIKVNGTYVTLGTATTDADGRLSLPVFKPARAGTYAIAIVNPLTGSTSYVKVVVKKKRP